MRRVISLYRTSVGKKFYMAVSGVVLIGDPDNPVNVIVDSEGFARPFYCNGVDNTSVISGFTIINGVDTNGGGVRVMGGSSLRIDHCIISNNRATDDIGGGMFIQSSLNPIIKNCEFNNNPQGSGIFIYGSSATIDSCSFTGNFGINGGGIDGVGTLINVTNSTFTDNRTTFGSGGGINYGDGVTGTIENCAFNSNISVSSGGAVFYSNCSLLIADCDIYGNQAANRGAGIHGGGGTALSTIDNCTIHDNIAGSDGGGIYSSGASVSMTITNCTVYGNSATGSGGGIHGEDQPAALAGRMDAGRGCHLPEEGIDVRARGFAGQLLVARHATLSLLLSF